MTVQLEVFAEGKITPQNKSDYVFHWISENHEDVLISVKANSQQEAVKKAKAFLDDLLSKQYTLSNW